MRVFLAGATGAVGTHLVPQLLEHGHTVVGTSRSAEGAARLRAAGADGVVLDVLDAWAVHDAVRDARPDAIVHQATALKGLSDFKHFDAGFAATNRLRAAARAHGVERVVAQSFAGWPSGRGAPGLTTEDDPLDPEPVPAMRE